MTDKKQSKQRFGKPFVITVIALFAVTALFIGGSSLSTSLLGGKWKRGGGGISGGNGSKISGTQNKGADSGGLCNSTDPNNQLPPMGEYFEYYAVPMEESTTHPYMEPPILDGNGKYTCNSKIAGMCEAFNAALRTMKYGYGESNPHSKWDHVWYAMMGFSQQGGYFGSGAYGWPSVLRGVRLGDTFDYTGHAWPGYGTFHFKTGDPEVDDPSGYQFSRGDYYYSFTDKDASGTSVACMNYIFVYNYDPQYVTLDRVQANNVAWWHEGQVAVYTEQLAHCKEHCDPADAYPNAFVNLRGRLIADPGVDNYRPFQVQVLHRGMAWSAPDTLEGNTADPLTASRIDDATYPSWKWRLQKALEIHGDETKPNANLVPANWPTSGEIIAALEPDVAAKTDMTAHQLHLGTMIRPGIFGFAYDAATDMTHFFDSTVGTDIYTADDVFMMLGRARDLEGADEQIAVKAAFDFAKEKYMTEEYGWQSPISGQGFVQFIDAMPVYIMDFQEAWSFQKNPIDPENPPKVFVRRQSTGSAINTARCGFRDDGGNKIGDALSTGGYLRVKGGLLLDVGTIVGGTISPMTAHLFAFNKSIDFAQFAQFHNFTLSNVLKYNLADPANLDKMTQCVKEGMEYTFLGQ